GDAVIQVRRAVLDEDAPRRSVAEETLVVVVEAAGEFGDGRSIGKLPTGVVRVARQDRQRPPHPAPGDIMVVLRPPVPPVLVWVDQGAAGPRLQPGPEDLLGRRFRLLAHPARSVTPLRAKEEDEPVEGRHVAEKELVARPPPAGRGLERGLDLDDE